MASNTVKMASNVAKMASKMPSKSALSTSIVLLTLSWTVVLITCPTQTTGQVRSNLKYVLTADTWQSSEDQHNIIIAQSGMADVECANYCTIKDSRFRKVSILDSNIDFRMK